jgi:hypothetical protein
VPNSGGFTYTNDTTGTSTFFNRYPDGNAAGRYVIGVDDGAVPNNLANFEVKSGILTVNGTDTVAAGKLVLSGGSVAIAQGGKIQIGKNIYYVDTDGDGYANGKLYVGSQPANGTRKNQATTLNTPDCDDSDATNKTKCGYGIAYDGDCVANGNFGMDGHSRFVVCGSGQNTYPLQVTFVVTSNTAAGATTVTLSSNPTGYFHVGEEVLIINLQGTTSDMTNVGLYETKYITSLTTTTVTLDSALVNPYNGTTQSIRIMRIPHFHNFTLCGGNTGGGCTQASFLQSSNWPSSPSAPVIFFRATGTVTINSGATIFSGWGYNGGTGGGGVNAGGQGGESFCGAGGAGNGNLVAGGSGASGGGSGYSGTPSNGGAGSCGGGGGAYPQAGNTQGTGSATKGGAGGGAATHGGGGGAGYGSAGLVGSATWGAQNGGTNVSGNGGMMGGGGGTYGTPTLSRLYLGSGGGKGGDANAGSGASGGKGRGIIAIFARNLIINGEIDNDGYPGTTKASCVANEFSGAGGGGSGGSTLLVGDTVTLGTNKVHAVGGAGGANSCGAGALNTTYKGGNGGDGRIAVKAFSSVSGTTSPNYVSIP